MKEKIFNIGKIIFYFIIKRYEDLKINCIKISNNFILKYINNFLENRYKPSWSSGLEIENY